MTTNSHKQRQRQDVFAALRGTAMAYGVPKLAGRLGVPVGTLYNKLSKSPDSHHKTTLQDFIQILFHAGDLAPLDALNRLFDSVRYQIPHLQNVSDDALLEIANRVHIEGGDVHASMNSALADGVVTPEEFDHFDRETMEWIAAILELRARFKSLVVMPCDNQAGSSLPSRSTPALAS